ncbi:MAG TPA: ribosome maturation factor RimP [Thermoanaerobaculia bacterium]|jgi:ribosome maturation factor RimP
MAHANIDGELMAELAAVAGQAGCELVHAEFRGGALRMFLDRPEGVTLEDCQTVSREVSALLDVADFGNGRYTLEVSSPGLDRQLYGPKDYQRFCGRLVRVTHVDPETRRKATFVGRLEAFRPGDREGNGEITVCEQESGRRHEVALSEVTKARLEVEW